MSFDNGDTWSRLGGNFPVVPVYDLIIKGVEMVVATHGRSFWILDDLTPFHELAKNAATSQGSRLFTPRSRERVRRYLGWGDDPYWGVVNYGQADVSLTHFDPIVRPDGTVGSKFLDAGENPPDGIVVQYLLPEREDLDVELTILDSAVSRFVDSAAILTAQHLAFLPRPDSTPSPGTCDIRVQPRSPRSGSLSGIDHPGPWPYPVNIRFG